MTALIWLIPIALLLGGLGLTAFFWSVRTGQFEDPQGDAVRIFADNDDKPLIDDTYKL